MHGEVVLMLGWWSCMQAQLLRDMGRGEDAIKGFEATLRLDKAYVQVRACSSSLMGSLDLGDAF